MYYNASKVPSEINKTADLSVILDWLATHFPNKQFITGSTPIHGVAHACRTAFLIRVWYNFYYKFDTRTDLLDSELLKIS